MMKSAWWYVREHRPNLHYARISFYQAEILCPRFVVCTEIKQINVLSALKFLWIRSTIYN